MHCDLQHLFFFVYKLAKSPNWILWIYNMDSSIAFMYDINSYKMCIRDRAKAVLVWGLCIYTITIPFMVWRLATREVKPVFCHTQDIVLAPCSLCLASYLNLAQEPSMALVGIRCV